MALGYIGLLRSTVKVLFTPPSSGDAGYSGSPIDVLASRYLVNVA